MGKLAWHFGICLALLHLFNLYQNTYLKILFLKCLLINTYLKHKHCFQIVFPGFNKRFANGRNEDSVHHWYNSFTSQWSSGTQTKEAMRLATTLCLLNIVHSIKQINCWQLQEKFVFCNHLKRWVIPLINMSTLWVSPGLRGPCLLWIRPMEQWT